MDADEHDNEMDIERARSIAELVEDSLRDVRWSVLNRIIDSIADPIFVKNEDLQWILVNKAFCDFVGIARHRLLGRTDADFFPPEEAEVFNAIDREVLDTRQPNINEEHLTSAKTSELCIIRTAKTMFVDDDGQRVLVGIFTDLTALRRAQQELEEANQRLRQMALTDELSQLPNRRAFIEELGRTVALSQRHDNEFAVLFCDLNGFKQVNDTHGHDAGDALIVSVAERLVEIARTSDFCARLGGDEFVVIAKMTDGEGAAVVAERICEAVGREHIVCGVTVNVSTSIGIACYPADANDREALLRQADLAMYHAKRVKQVPYVFYADMSDDDYDKAMTA